MPIEVIDLLSSSPAASPSPVSSRSPKVLAKTRSPAASGAIGYDDVFDLAFATRAAKGKSKRTVSGSKQASSSRQDRPDDESLFVSDDSKLPNILKHGVSKKPRLSPSAPRIREGNPTSSLTRTKSAVAGSTSRKPLPRSEMRRWKSLADPIEHSSSPKADDYVRPQKKTADGSSDPFTSPPPRHSGNFSPPRRSSRNEFSIVDSPPDRISTSNAAQNTGWKWPTGLSNQSSTVAGKSLSKPDSRRSSVVDMSSDPFETSPPRGQPRPAKSNGSWDPISSSMPEKTAVYDPTSSPPPTRTYKKAGKAPASSKYSIESDESEDLPDLDDIDFSKIRSKKRSFRLSLSPPRKVSRTSTGSTISTVKTKASAQVAKTAEDKEREKRQKANERAAEQERKRAEKEIAKKQRELEKEREKALAEVNKVRTDKKVSTPEMIVDVPASLEASLKLQIEELLKDLDVQHETWYGPVENAVKWRRKVSSRYDKEAGHWEPIPMHIEKENHVMVLIKAAAFVKLVLGSEGADLEAHVLKMKTSHPDVTIIYLIEGLTAWMRKNRNFLNRQFTSAVRNLDLVNADREAASSSQSRRRGHNNKRQQQEYVDEDTIEDALLSLQVVHGALIHHTNAPIESAQWVAVFTQHISTIPYRRARDAATADAGFCMDAGQVRTGDGPKDTYVRMLREVPRVTQSIAYGIAAKYPSVTELVRGLESEGPLALEDCRKGANRDGAFTDQMVGRAISKRLYKIFTSRDPGSTDI